MPLVSVGLPVYNGERYLREALDALLAQTLSDFEIIVSDNASTDATPSIARAYADRDRRVRYHRNPRNLGAAPNFNQILDLAQGTYFRWHACDDLVLPTFLERCVAVLEAQPEVVLCHTHVLIVDAEGRPLRTESYGPRTDDPDPRRRFDDLLLVRNDCYEVFGLIRADVLRATRRIGSYPVGDRVLLAELALRGRFHEVTEALFLSRDHPGRSVRSLRTQRERAAWFDARYEGRITLPEWRTFAEYCKAILRSPLRMSPRPWLCMLRWLYRYKLRMASDVLVALAQLLSRMGRITTGP